MPRCRHAVALLLVMLFLLGAGAAAAQPAGHLEIQLTPGANEALVNGDTVALEAPAVIKGGHTLVPLRFVGETLETAVDWNAEDRSILITSPDRKVLLHVGNPTAAVNGTGITLNVAPQIIGERTMVPLRFVSETLGAEVSFQPDTKLITILRKVRDQAPIADFAFEASVITPDQTPTVLDRSRHPLGLAIVDREWTNLRERYAPGTYEVTLRVQDETGLWSAPVTRTLKVKEPPTAGFRTEKSTYRLGEPIVYVNESSDPDGGPLKLQWEAQPAYFEPGTQQVRLTVTDEYGLSATATETVLISDRVYYTKEEYYLLYGGDSAVVPYEEAVLEFPVLEPEVKAGDRTLLRVNSPEEIRTEGILYRDTASGPVRIMVHHLNRMAVPINLHALVHNPSPDPVTVRVTRQGTGGPAGDILRLGRLHLERFFAPQSARAITVPAGATISLLPGLSDAQMKPNDCFTGLWDLEVCAPLDFTFVALPAGQDPVTALDRLAPLAADGKHVRGTFPGADRLLGLDRVPDGERTRLILADSLLDPPAEGTDALTGQAVRNTGNYGVVYQLTFDRLPGNTALLLNPRGGNFCGAVRAGQKVVPAPASGYIPPQRHAVILVKNEKPGPVALEFSPPSGSYLPVNILSLPLPKWKGEPGPLLPDK